MLADGERIKVLLAKAQHRVLLCSPFVKARVLETVLSMVPASVAVRVVTRWRAREIAAGVSDLEVLDITNRRERTELMLLDDLHAKLYLADEECLVGSANLTAKALGWVEHSNVELLVSVTVTDENVAMLLRRLEFAEPATFRHRSELEAEVALLAAEHGPTRSLDEGSEVAEWSGCRALAWLPRCAAPQKLYEIYRNTETTVVTDGTKADGVEDLRDLNIFPGLLEEEFVAIVKDGLRLMPAVARILREVPRGLTDKRGGELAKDVRPELSGADASKQWRIVREWIGVFFWEDFEVAPETFVTRLKVR